MKPLRRSCEGVAPVRAGTITELPALICCFKLPRHVDYCAVLDMMIETFSIRTSPRGE
jgi:hypothetical protein